MSDPILFLAFSRTIARDSATTAFLKFSAFSDLQTLGAHLEYGLHTHKLVLLRIEKPFESYAARKVHHDTQNHPGKIHSAAIFMGGICSTSFLALLDATLIDEINILAHQNIGYSFQFELIELIWCKCLQTIWFGM